MDLYYSPYASSTGAILLLGKVFGVEINKIPINIQAKEQLKPEFVKLNPQHTIPTIVDNGFSLWESRVILTYLIDKYAKDDSLYPKDDQKRAVVNQRLYFDLGTLHKALAEYYYPQFRKKEADPELFKKVEEALSFLNSFLEGQQYLAGDSLTVADIAILSTLAFFQAVGLDISKYSNVAKWYENGSKVTPAWDEIENTHLIKVMSRSMWISRQPVATNMDFYYSPYSSMGAAILLIGKALGLEINKIHVNVHQQEQLKPEFVKLNPQHTIPTLNDNGFVVWESRAILTYLVEQYGKDDSLYPKDPQKRALVNQRLYFDMGKLYKSFLEYFYQQIQKKPEDPELFKKVEAALEFLNIFLEGEKYVAGDSFTVADIAILATVANLKVINVDYSKYTNIVRWYENGRKEAPGWEEVENTADTFKAVIEARK
ncbi:LOW QUALITY PROTEIN: uncharacterized protein LOC132784187 [Drosophila nasuta]|uniref:LOW QUALITY PROTEIN: uncharacterized protein LOC132784187 n=1 Tax=Drosophila nasuta TaxID=42062 RepID=UPI00295EBD3F|nr:LOW QUALITY PROTEIN: uncharacterized protein LOC132784187 [Drosophila nasuta]